MEPLNQLKSALGRINQPSEPSALRRVAGAIGGRAIGGLARKIAGNKIKPNVGMLGARMGNKVQATDGSSYHSSGEGYYK